jgi:type IV secretion system protein VirD4
VRTIKALKIISYIVAVLLFHGYVGGAGISAFMTINQADWTNGEIGPALGEWEKDYLNPVDVYTNVLIPTTDFQKTVSVRTLYSLPVSAILFALIFFGYMWKKKTYKVDDEYGSHGTARWATRKEIFRDGEITGNPYNEINSAGVILGYEEKANGKPGEYIVIPPDAEINQNILIYGNSGIGKDFTYMKTQIFHSMQSYVPKGEKRKKKMKDRLIPSEYSLMVIDPKGEGYRDTAPSLRANGYETYAFNLNHMKHSHRWNALDYVSNDIEADILANLIVSNGFKGTSTGDPFWPKAERALMAAVILFVKYETPPVQQNLANVLHIGLTYNNEDELDILFESLPYNHPALMKYRIFKQAAEETRSGILVGFGTELMLFTNRDISLITSQSDFKLDNMGLKKTALFLIIPDGNDTFAPITSLLMTQAFQEWWKVADDHGGTCPVGIRVLANEFANIGRIPMLGKRASVMRSKGVSIQIFLQGRAQLDELYDKEAEIIAFNCDTTVYLGTKDPKTAKQMEEDLGKMTIEVQSYSKEEGSLLAAKTNVSTQRQERFLRNADEILRNSRKKNIIIQSGSYPFETIKTPFIDHYLAKDYKKEDPKSVVPPKHNGFDLFSKDDYNRIIGAVLEPSSVIAEDVVKNLDNQLGSDMFNGLDVLEKIHTTKGTENPVDEQLMQHDHDDDYILPSISEESSPNHIQEELSTSHLTSILNHLDQGSNDAGLGEDEHFLNSISNITEDDYPKLGSIEPAAQQTIFINSDTPEKSMKIDIETGEILEQIEAPTASEAAVASLEDDNVVLASKEVASGSEAAQEPTEAPTASEAAGVSPEDDNVVLASEEVASESEAAQEPTEAPTASEAAEAHPEGVDVSIISPEVKNETVATLEQSAAPTESKAAGVSPEDENIPVANEAAATGSEATQEKSAPVNKEDDLKDFLKQFNN